MYHHGEKMSGLKQKEPFFIILTNSEKSKIWYQNNRERKKLYEKEYRKNHKEQKATKDREYRLRLKTEVFSHYSNGKPKCAFCGEDDLDRLELDHIDGDGKKQRTENHIAVGTGTWLWAKRNHYPPIFQVLCANCNSVKGHSATNLRQWLEVDNLIIPKYVWNEWTDFWDIPSVQINDLLKKASRHD